MTCAHCGAEVPDGSFCASCGAAQEAAPRAARRWQSFAAHPSEHVARVNVLSSLLPRLEHGRVHDFRWALLTGVVSLTALYLLGLIAAAVMVAALIVPLLYLIYVREAQVFGSTPGSTLAITAGGGALLGMAVSLGLDRLVGVRSLIPVTGTGMLLLLTVAVPLIEEALKPLPALLQHRHRELRHPLDGLGLGVAAGLGFATAQTLVNLSDVILNVPFRVDPAAWIYPLVSSALLLPLLQAACTGTLTAAIWRAGERGHLTRAAAGVAAAATTHVAFSLGSQLLLEHGPGHVAVLTWQGAVVAAIVVVMRLVLHDALLEEGAEHGLTELVCPHCRNRVMAGRFCPTCGLAVVAARRSAQPAAGGAVPHVR